MLNANIIAMVERKNRLIYILFIFGCANLAAKVNKLSDNNKNFEFFLINVY